MSDQVYSEKVRELTSLIDSLEDSTDAGDHHKFHDTLQTYYEDGFFHELLESIREKDKKSAKVDNTE